MSEPLKARLLRHATLALLLLAAARPARAADEANALAAAREAVDRILRRESEVLPEVERAESALRAAEESARLARSEEQAARKAVSEATGAEAEAEAELAARVEQLGPRLRARYRLERRGTAGLLLGQSSAAELLRRQRGLSRIVAADLAAIARTRAAGERLRELQAALEPLQEQVAARTTEAESASSRARTEAETRRTLLASLREERAVQQAVVAELAREAERLSERVASLPRVHAGSGFGARKGRLPPPVAGGIVEVGFGKVVNPKFNTVTIQKGWDIRAAEGSPVLAVAPGKVAHAGWFGAYGNLLILDHGDGFFTLYAHLAAVARAVGDDIGAEEQVGSLGDTASLKGSYLYFEIRHGERPVDPRDWVRAR